jgi:phosphinothricin acetyltransferase
MIGTFYSSGFKFGRWIDTVLMQKELGEGGHTPPMEAA